MDACLPRQVGAALRAVRYRIGRLTDRSARRHGQGRTRQLALRHAQELARICAEESARSGKRGAVGILLGEHIGDLIACEPVSRELRRRHPDRLIVWIVRRRFAELVRTFQAVDITCEIGCLGEACQMQRAGFVNWFNLHFDGRGCRKCGVTLSNAAAGQSVTAENYFQFGGLLPAFCRVGGLPPLNEAPQLRIPEPIARRAERWRLPEGFVAFHCRANDKAKNWEAAKWAELARQISRRHGRPVVEIGRESVLAGGGTGAYNLCKRLSLLESAEVIRRAALFVGIDSGPAHMANALGRPGVVLMGRLGVFEGYVPFTGGYADGSSGTIVREPRGRPVAELDVAAALSAVWQRLEMSGNIVNRTG